MSKLNTFERIPLEIILKISEYLFYRDRIKFLFFMSKNVRELVLNSGYRHQREFLYLGHFIRTPERVRTLLKYLKFETVILEEFPIDEFNKIFESEKIESIDVKLKKNEDISKLKSIRVSCSYLHLEFDFEDISSEDCLDIEINNDPDVVTLFTHNKYAPADIQMKVKCQNSLRLLKINNLMFSSLEIDVKSIEDLEFECAYCDDLKFQKSITPKCLEVYDSTVPFEYLVPLMKDLESFSFDLSGTPLNTYLISELNLKDEVKEICYSICIPSTFLAIAGSHKIEKLNMPLTIEDPYKVENLRIPLLITGPHKIEEFSISISCKKRLKKDNTIEVLFENEKETIHIDKLIITIDVGPRETENVLVFRSDKNPKRIYINELRVFRAVHLEISSDLEVEINNAKLSKSVKVLSSKKAKIQKIIYC
jgi:hypothetical protein